MLEIPMFTGPVPLENTALLVVDMQRCFFDSSYSLGQVGMDVTPLRKAIPGTLRLLDAARAAGVPVIFTRFVYQRGLVDFPVRPTARAEARKRLNSLGEGTEEAELIPELAVRDNEIIIDKSRPSSFYGTRLEPVLTAQRIRNLVICGVTTNICVETTARDAGQRDFGTYVVRDAVAEVDEMRNHYALFGISWNFGEIVTVDHVARCWGVEAPRAAANA